MAFRDAMDITWFPVHVLGGPGAGGRRTERGIPLWEAIPSQVHLPHYWKVVALVMSSMADEGLLQHNSDMIMEEEREESMETDTPLDSAAPTPLKEKAIPEDLKAEGP